MKKNWLENLKNSDIINFIKENFNIKYRDFTFEEVSIKNLHYIKINLTPKHGFPAEICGNDFIEEEIYLGEYFIESYDGKINNNAYDFYKLQVDNKKMVFEWQKLISKSNKNNLINNKTYSKSLALKMKNIITNYYEDMCTRIAIKYLHADRSIYSKNHEKFLDEVDFLTDLENLKKNYKKDKHLLNNYIKNLSDKYEKTL